MLRIRPAGVVVLWGLLLLGIAVRAAWTPERHSVYPIYADAGRHWRAGTPCYGYLRADRDIFRFSPVVAAGLIPFGMLSDRVGGPLWLLLNAGVFFGGLVWFVRVVRPGAAAAAGLIGLALVP